MCHLHRIMLLCRPGFESECAAEMMDYAAAAGFAAYVNTNADSGYALVVNARQDDMTALMDATDFRQLVFPRQWFACTDRIDALPPGNRTVPLAGMAGRIANQLHSRFADIELGYADTNEGKAISRFCRSFRPHLRAALKQQQLLDTGADLRLHVFFVDSASAWIGASPLANSASEPMGIPRLRMPKSAPSRSTLKLDEAIRWFFDDRQQQSLFKPGMRAVDLGAAPGGWSWQLVHRGLLVTAVDNGPMDNALMRTGMVEHLRTDAFTYRPDSRIDWLVGDMAERPLHVSRLVARWFTQRLCRFAIFNLKLPMKKRYQSVMECKQLLTNELNNAGISYRLHIKQLYHDREEVTACLVSENAA